jgi:hypothetical protein
MGLFNNPRFTHSTQNPMDTIPELVARLESTVANIVGLIHSLPLDAEYTVRETQEIVRQTRLATAIAETINNRVAGNPPPKTGP